MKVAILELPASWNEPARVLADLDELVRQASVPADLVIVPEQAISGYISPEGDADLAPFAEAIDGPIATECARLATAHRTHLVAPLVLREGSAIYNAMICYAPDGSMPFVYRKRHPWIPETWATPGREPLPVVTIADRAVTIAICYDVHFLVGESRAQLDAADVLLFPSAWVEDPDYRIPRLAALAQRFGLHVVNANWGAGDVIVPGQGNSCIVGPDGRVLARALDGRIDRAI